nr:PREDICTED: sperm acrosome membrane-associated protein 3 [Bos indicus]
MGPDRRRGTFSVRTAEAVDAFGHPLLWLGFISGVYEGGGPVGGGGVEVVRDRPVSPPYAGICLAYFASGFNTGAVDHEADGSTNSGIFQINSRKWCKNLNPNVPNLCQMYCSDLLNPNLKDTVICAMKITQEPQGLGSWEAWRHHCQGKDLSDWVDGCEL